LGQGHTVFVVSWHNPDSEDRDTGLEDYRTLGVLAALDAIGHVLPDRQVHAAGYCLGGTLLTIAAAAMARDGDKRLASVTLFAAQTDFTEAGELLLFTDEDQISFLEDAMEQGYLDGRQMGADRPVAISDIRAPMFVVATETDHVSPWRSVYKLHLLVDTDLTFLLTSGGHNAGIVSPPGHPRRHHRVTTHPEGQPYRDPDTWLQATPVEPGSWWPRWERWLAERSGDRVAPPTAPTGLAPAPGTYVLER
jgi:poly[(R)-3-hydroxyalkanoate] polymerase subunit PhaC